MLSSYGKLHRSAGLALWLSRSMATEAQVQASVTRRMRARPKPDAVTKKASISRKRRTRTTSIKGDGMLSAAHKVVEDDPGHSDTTSKPTPIRTKSVSEASSGRTVKTKRAQANMSWKSRLLATMRKPSTKHHDLASFRRHAMKANLDRTSPSFKGTFFEYMTPHALKPYNFDLVPVGQPNDRGIDLLGYWKLPNHTKQRPNLMPVIGQCKASKIGPRMIRELEGLSGGAPAEWQGDHVLRMLVATGKSTTGVREAMGLSRLPMGLMQLSEDGKLKQFHWNDAAKKAGLEGMGAKAQHMDVVSPGKGQKRPAAPILESTIALSWLDKLWRPRTKTPPKVED